jgi:hypothetical protein
MNGNTRRLLCCVAGAMMFPRQGGVEDFGEDDGTGVEISKRRFLQTCKSAPGPRSLPEMV